MTTDVLSRSLSPTKKGKGKKDEDSAVVDEHPLRTSNPYTPTFASSFDGTLTRPSLRRQLRAASPFDNVDGPTTGMMAEVSPFVHGGRSRSYSESAGSSVGDDWTSTPGASSSASTPPEPRADDTTREVVVHEVQATDSLAGVALMYGIKIAALRKANKLWTSDSIHLRKVLYIPVDWQKWPKAKRRPGTILEAEEPSSSSHSQSSLYTDGLSPTRELSSSPILASSSAIPPAYQIPSHSHRRTQTQHIPASELSFFPSRPTLVNTSEPVIPSPSSPASSSLTITSSSYFTLPTRPNSSSNQGRTSVFSVLNTMNINGLASGLHGIGKSRMSMSTDSLVSSSIARTSMSDDGNGRTSPSGADVGEEVVELDVARETWRNTPSSVLRSRSKSRSRPSTDDVAGNGRSDSWLNSVSMPTAPRNRNSLSSPPTSPTQSRSKKPRPNGLSLSPFDSSYGNTRPDSYTYDDNHDDRSTGNSESGIRGVTTRQPKGVRPMSIPSASLQKR